MSRTPVIALLDANVLYPAPLRDYLLHLASLGVYEPIWTAAIQDEWIRNLVKARPDINRAALEATQRSMDKAFPGSIVMGYVKADYLTEKNSSNPPSTGLKTFHPSSQSRPGECQDGFFVW